MASPNIYSSGIGGSSGSELATASRLYSSGFVWYVSFSSGTDAASPAGRERNRPLKTLSQAYTNASAGDVIVLLSGHTETLTSAQTLGKAGLLVIGEGSGTTRPTFTRGDDVNVFNVTAAGVLIDNIIFNDTFATAVNPAAVKTASTETVLKNCQFQMGDDLVDVAANIGFEMVTGAGQVRIEDTRFVVVSDATYRPASAIKVTNAMSDLELSGVTLDGGPVGWAQPYAFNGAAAITRLTTLNVDLYNDSDITLATGTTGNVHVRSTTGSAKVVWAA
jgi:hypothetical protein